MLKLLGKMRPKVRKQHLDLKHEEGLKISWDETILWNKIKKI